jgi:hypothetical protein
MVDDPARDPHRPRRRRRPICPRGSTDSPRRTREDRRGRTAWRAWCSAPSRRALGGLADVLTRTDGSGSLLAVAGEMTRLAAHAPLLLDLAEKGPDRAVRDRPGAAGQLWPRFKVHPLRIQLPPAVDARTALSGEHRRPDLLPSPGEMRSRVAPAAPHPAAGRTSSGPCSRTRRYHSASSTSPDPSKLLRPGGRSVAERPPRRAKGQPPRTPVPARAPRPLRRPLRRALPRASERLDQIQRAPAWDELRSSRGAGSGSGRHPVCRGKR